jgi:hypothetical protein
VAVHAAPAVQGEAGGRPGGGAAGGDKTILLRQRQNIEIYKKKYIFLKVTLERNCASLTGKFLKCITFCPSSNQLKSVFIEALFVTTRPC